MTDSIKRFDPDFTLVRLKPRIIWPWERYETTWDDIMTEIGDEKILGGLNAPTRHEIVDERLDKIEAAMLRTSKLMRQLSGNQVGLFKLMERHFGKSDGVSEADPRK